MKTQCSGNFVKYMKAKLMRSPNHGECRVTTGCFLSQKEASFSSWLHSVELLAKVVLWKSPILAVAKISGCSPQPDRGVLLPGQHSQNSLNMKKLRGYLYGGLHSYILVSLLQVARRYSAGCQWRNVNTSPVTKPLTIILYSHQCQSNGVTELVEGVIQCLICLKAQSVRRNPYLILLV